MSTSRFTHANSRYSESRGAPVPWVIETTGRDMEDSRKQINAQLRAAGYPEGPPGYDSRLAARKAEPKCEWWGS